MPTFQEDALRVLNSLRSFVDDDMCEAQEKGHKHLADAAKEKVSHVDEMIAYVTDRDYLTYAT